MITLYSTVEIKDYRHWGAGRNHTVYFTEEETMDQREGDSLPRGRMKSQAWEPLGFL